MLEAARLYAITPDAEPDAVVGLVGAVLRGGADVVQLRHKTLARGRLLELAAVLEKMVHQANRLFIVNDHLDIALIAGADGVHLGDDDLPLEAARRVAGDGFLIGASANTPGLARAAVAAGADYLGCGPAFATSIKPDKAVIGPRAWPRSRLRSRSRCSRSAVSTAPTSVSWSRPASIEPASFAGSPTQPTRRRRRAS